MWEPQDIGLATGVLGSIRSMGGAIATALYSSVLANEVDKNLPKYVVPAATGTGLPESSVESLFAAITAGDLTEVPGISPEIIAAVGSALKTAYELVQDRVLHDRSIRGHFAAERVPGAGHGKVSQPQCCEEAPGHKL